MCKNFFHKILLWNCRYATRLPCDQSFSVMNFLTQKSQINCFFFTFIISQFNIYDFELNLRNMTYKNWKKLSWSNLASKFNFDESYYEIIHKAIKQVRESNRPPLFTTLLGSGQFSRGISKDHNNVLFVVVSKQKCPLWA